MSPAWGPFNQITIPSPVWTDDKKPNINMKKFHWILLVLLVAAAIMTSLSYRSDPGDRTTVRFLNQETDPSIVAVQRGWIAGFTEGHPEIRIRLESASNTVINQRIATYVQAGAPLDVVHSDPGSAARLTAAGLLAPLDDVIERLGGRDAFLPGRLLIHNDRVYGINQAGAVPVLHYRKDVFLAAGLQPPETWDDLLHAARTLHSPDMAGIALPGGENRATTMYAGIFLWQNAGDFFNSDLELTIDHPRTYDALRFYAELLACAPPDAASWGFTEPIESFWAGRAAMLLYWHGLDLTFKQNPALIENIGVVAAPKGRMRVTQEGGRYIGVFANSNALEESKHWVEYIFTPEHATLLSEVHPMLYPPATHRAMELLRNSNAPTIQAYGDTLFNVVYPSAEFAYNEIFNAGGINPETLAIDKTGVLNPLVGVLWNSNLYARAVQRVAYQQWTPERAAGDAHHALAQQIEVARRELAQ
jgi:multiple sugar transport system substrate-binding protein